MGSLHITDIALRSLEDFLRQDGEKEMRDGCYNDNRTEKITMRVKLADERTVEFVADTGFVINHGDMIFTAGGYRHVLAAGQWISVHEGPFNPPEAEATEILF